MLLIRFTLKFRKNLTKREKIEQLVYTFRSFETKEIEKKTFKILGKNQGVVLAQFQPLFIKANRVQLIVFDQNGHGPLFPINTL